MPKKIISIQGRAESGVSRPFVCEDQDGRSFFVKRSNVTWDQLVLEYVVGRLAQEFGLPVAPFETLEIPEQLAQLTLAKDRAEFHPGIAFGSQRVPFGEDIRESHARHVADDIKIAVICFDWWLGNSDRSSDRLGSGSNLLWDPIMHGLVLIDHDRAFDAGFDAEEFGKEHAFRSVLPFIESASLLKLRKKLEAVVNRSFESIWDEVPTDWLMDESGANRAELTDQKIKSSILEPKLPIDGLLSLR